MLRSQAVIPIRVRYTSDICHDKEIERAMIIVGAHDGNDARDMYLTGKDSLGQGDPKIFMWKAVSQST